MVSQRHYWTLGELLDDYHYWKRAGHPRNEKARASRDFYLRKVGAKNSDDINRLCRQAVEQGTRWRKATKHDGMGEAVARNERPE